ncbi:unnamed protein product [Citrullus colocynthis]|uniref:Uncharacterized protein n=1 Tax=Citrullus colocynthis TaxID=252529 RepID=A0ABP0YKG0_9ROSI
MICKRSIIFGLFSVSITPKRVINCLHTVITIVLTLFDASRQYRDTQINEWVVYIDCPEEDRVPSPSLTNSDSSDDGGDHVDDPGHEYPFTATQETHVDDDEERHTINAHESCPVDQDHHEVDPLVDVLDATLHHETATHPETTTMKGIESW